ncbi:MAG: hypothetical protein K2P95_07555, partial [Hyphomonadaceae bacterium]|nr:hypothetical protein [Hyphomonadaceae bacterium]
MAQFDNHGALLSYRRANKSARLIAPTGKRIRAFGQCCITAYREDATQTHRMKAAPMGRHRLGGQAGEIRCFHTIPTEPARRQTLETLAEPGHAAEAADPGGAVLAESQRE